MEAERVPEAETNRCRSGVALGGDNLRFGFVDSPAKVAGPAEGAVADVLVPAAGEAEVEADCIAGLSGSGRDGCDGTAEEGADCKG